MGPILSTGQEVFLAPINNMPKEILAHIFSYVKDENDYFNTKTDELRLVCNQWKNVINDNKTMVYDKHIAAFKIELEKNPKASKESIYNFISNLALRRLFGSQEIAQIPVEQMFSYLLFNTAPIAKTNREVMTIKNDVSTGIIKEIEGYFVNLGIIEDDKKYNFTLEIHESGSNDGTIYAGWSKMSNNSKMSNYGTYFKDLEPFSNKKIISKGKLTTSFEFIESLIKKGRSTGSDGREYILASPT